MVNEKNLKLSLLLLRIGVFVVMAIWTLDKFLRPEHASAVWQNFYSMPAFGPAISYVIGVVQALIVLGFVLGFQKKITYGLVTFLHGISTLSSYKGYINPFEGPNILFFAAWPMLAACIALYLLRDDDTMWTI